MKETAKETKKETKKENKREALSIRSVPRRVRVYSPLRQTARVFQILLFGALFGALLGGCGQTRMESTPPPAESENTVEEVRTEARVVVEERAGPAVEYPANGSESVEPIGAENNLVVVTPGYATNRMPLDNGYGKQLAENVSYGFVEVSIPPNHVSGRLERPSTPWYWIDERESAEKHVVLRRLLKRDKDTFLSELVNADNESILLFVHGYNVSFEEAALRSGQLYRDLRFPGKFVFFSWASDGDTGGYTNDGTKIADSVEDISDFVQLLAAREQVQSMYMLGHSMGSRGLTRALASIKEKLSPNAAGKLKELILVEPDISQNNFRTRIAPGLRDLGARVTIYASENDGALAISNPVNNGVPRLGQAGEHLYIADGFETIDSSDIGMSFFSLNHSEYAENVEFLHELNDVIEGKPAELRPGLVKRDRHWYLVPGGSN